MEKMMESGVQRHAQSGSVAAHLDYREVERVFELDTSFNSGRAEIWQLVRNDLGEMNRFMRDGVLALREVKEVSEEQGHPRSEEHVWTPVTTEHLVCRLLTEKQK